MQFFSLREEASIAKRGQWMGFTIAVLFLLFATGLIASGKQVAGTILASVDVASLAAVFVFRQVTLLKTDSRVTPTKPKDE